MGSTLRLACSVLRASDSSSGIGRALGLVVRPRDGRRCKHAAASGEAGSTTGGNRHTMNASFLPGFEVFSTDAEKGLRPVQTLDSNEVAPVLVASDENPAPRNQGCRYYRHPSRAPMTSVQSKPSRFDAFQFRVQQFLRSLPRSRRLEIAARPRFRNMPFLCRVDDHNPDDTLP